MQRSVTEEGCGCCRFGTWLDDAGQCAMRPVETFAAGLALDGDAVRAALTTSGRRGQAEGQITHLKPINS